MKYSYKQILEQRERYFPAETCDCAVMTVAVAADLTYKKAHALCMKYGRPSRRGMRQSYILRMYNHLGFTWQTRTRPKQPNGNGYTLKTITNGYSDANSYLVFTREHMAAIRDGQLQDWATNSRMRVISVLTLSRDKKAV